ncbi:hypothetical protein ASZ90_017206 [hydrocarbon metagenome]|uniref:DUF5305 domain-containing protein n=1 Tax=hydrocarbon metagenome TaxID=938273 RepID=A0A0W8EA13_9ZZZZ
MAQLEIKSKVRKGIIIGLAVLFAAMSAVTGWFFQRPAETQTQVPVLSWQQTAAVDYKVKLDSSTLFPGQEDAGPGRAYLTALTDYVDTELHYQFKADDKAEISGEYEVVADLTGYMLVEKEGQKQSASLERERVLVWSKSYQLVEPTVFSGSGKDYELNLPVDIPIIDYMAFVSQVLDATRYSPEVVEVKVRYYIKSEAVTAQGTISQELEPILLLPAQGRAFRITGKLTDQKQDAFTEAQLLPVPGLKGKKTASVLGVLLTALLLGATWFLTRVKEENVFEEKVMKIFKDFGDRIILASGPGLTVKDEKILELQSFTDLIKVADEVGQMILYEADNDRCYRFYLLAESGVYRYVLEDREAVGNGLNTTRASD